MPGKTSEWRAVRSIHLQGGCRAVNGLNPKVQLEPLASNGQIASLTTPTYHGVFALLQGAGFLVLGADFYFDPAQTDSRRLPDWRTYHKLGLSTWPCAEQADQWSFVAHAAIQRKNGKLWDVASRICHQLRTCDWRVRQISECYRDQLSATVLAGKFKDGLRFVDGFTSVGYLAIQAFLMDACVLRDYLAEYRALLLSQEDKFTFRSKITGMAALKKKYLDKTDSNIPVDTFLRDATSPEGWLYELGKYRDLVVHVAPLASAGKSLYAMCKAIELDGGAALPSIKLPIPSAPHKISDARTSGTYFDDSELNFARFKNALKDYSSTLDGLEYAHSTLGRLAHLAWHLSFISPIKPEIPEVTEADIIEIESDAVWNSDES
jgi:hypothetical protein